MREERPSLFVNAYLTKRVSTPLEVRRIMYTTNAIEDLNMQARKAIKNRGHFPNDEAAKKN